MNTSNLEGVLSIDIYNVCLAYVTGQLTDATVYRDGIRELKLRNEHDLIYSIALNVK